MTKQIKVGSPTIKKIAVPPIGKTSKNIRLTVSVDEPVLSTSGKVYALGYAQGESEWTILIDGKERHVRATVSVYIKIPPVERKAKMTARREEQLMAGAPELY